METGRSQQWGFFGGFLFVFLFFYSTGKLFYDSVLSDCVQFTILLEANRQREARHETLKSSVPETTSSAHQRDSSARSTTRLSPAPRRQFKAILPPPPKTTRVVFSAEYRTREKSILYVILLVAIWKKRKENIPCIYAPRAHPLHLEQKCHLNHSKQKLQSIPESLIGYNALNKCCQNIKKQMDTTCICWKQTQPCPG